MNKHLQQLIQIAQIDKEADALVPVMQQKHENLDKLLATKHEHIATQSRLAEEKEEKRQAIARNEAIIAENNAKLDAITERIKDGCSDREARTLAIEEDLAKEQIKHANNEIERINKELDSIPPKEQEIAQALIELESAIQEEQAKVDEAVKEITQEQQAIFAKKEQCIATMDQNVIVFYEKIRKWAKNTSVVPITRQACGGCFIRLNDRLLGEIIHSSSITTCPHCGRILYIES